MMARAKAFLGSVASRLSTDRRVPRRLRQLVPLVTNEDTIRHLADRLFLGIDHVICCPPHGLVLVGWILQRPGSECLLQVRCGSRVSELRLDQCIRFDRPDVMETVGAPNGIVDLCSGFVGFLPDVLEAGEPLFLEVETRGLIGRRRLTPSPLTGLAATKALLSLVDLRYGAVAPAYDRVLGPSIELLNAERLHPPAQAQCTDFGAPPTAPVLTVIVTLHGRLDFMEYQFGFLSRRTDQTPVEMIYVLDDPDQRRHAESLAESIYERFRIPFRLAVLSRNVGYAPANNAGLKLTRSEYVCFMNSDVFAISDDWMDRILERLRSDDRLGAIGPLLLFEDDSVQHAGMTFERVPQFGGWRFPMHDSKGWRRPAARGLAPCVAVTGACLVMRTAVARELGGFDEAFAIGDFEDADLCLKLGNRGLHCAVDLDVHLYHLERQSQAEPGQRWRMNLTLYNAWTHERRWAAVLDTLDRPPLQKAFST